MVLQRKQSREEGGGCWEEVRESLTFCPKAKQVTNQAGGYLEDEAPGWRERVLQTPRGGAAALAPSADDPMTRVGAEPAPPCTETDGGLGRSLGCGMR